VAINDKTCTNGPGVQLWEYTGDLSQQWILNEFDSSIESLLCPGLVLDIEGDDDILVCENGVSLVIATKDRDGRKSQSWSIRDDGIIESKRCPNYVVDIQGYGTHNGVPIYLWNLHSEWNQIWQFLPFNSILNNESLPSMRRHLRTSKAFKAKPKTSKQLFAPLSPVESTASLNSLVIATACNENECFDPSGVCKREVACLTDPCLFTKCGDNEVCTPNFCGGCHAVCSEGFFH
jgi:hypothetical protein